jgi:three-Cys-motif partner protein
MVEQRFGSTHTDTKLQKLAAYLRAFNTALKNKPNAAQPFERLYVDAFAGTGEIETAESNLPLIDGAEMDAFIPGSVRRALEVEPPFHRYVFAERDAGKAKALQTLASSHADADSDEFGHLLRSEFVRGRVSFRRMTIAW